MDEFALGQQVLVSHTLFKDKTGNFSRWLPTKVAVEPRLGIIVGKRRLANGKRYYAGYDEGFVFEAEEYFVAYMIAFDIRTKHHYAISAHITAA